MLREVGRGHADPPHELLAGKLARGERGEDRDPDGVAERPMDGCGFAVALFHTFRIPRMHRFVLVIFRKAWRNQGMHKPIIAVLALCVAGALLPPLEAQTQNNQVTPLATAPRMSGIAGEIQGLSASLKET